jgi:hypothetical protein
MALLYMNFVFQFINQLQTFQTTRPKYAIIFPECYNTFSREFTLTEGSKQVYQRIRLLKRLEIKSECLADCITNGNWLNSGSSSWSTYGRQLYLLLKDSISSINKTFKPTDFHPYLLSITGVIQTLTLVMRYLGQ